MLSEYYKRLGLPVGAGENQIRQAYRRKAKILHPDLNSSPEAHSEFLQLQEAYEILLFQKEQSHYQRINPNYSNLKTTFQQKKPSHKDSIWNPYALKSLLFAFLGCMIFLGFVKPDFLFSIQSFFGMIFLAFLMALLLSTPVSIALYELSKKR